MSLAQESEARKARLLALRKKRAGESTDENRLVMLPPSSYLVLADTYRQSLLATDQSVFSALVILIRKHEHFVNVNSKMWKSRTLLRGTSRDWPKKSLPRMRREGLRTWYFLALTSMLCSHSTCVQDLFNIAPKRPNWDLKREMDKKLAKLDRQTQQAVHTLIRTFTRIFFAFPSLISSQDNVLLLRKDNLTTSWLRCKQELVSVMTPLQILRMTEKFYVLIKCTRVFLVEPFSWCASRS